MMEELGCIQRVLETHKGIQAEEGCAGVSGELVGVMAGAKGVTHGCGKKLGWKERLAGPRGPCLPV